MNNHFKMLHCQTIEDVDSDYSQLDMLDNGLPVLNSNVSNVCSQGQSMQNNRFFLDEMQNKNNGVRGLIARAFQLINKSPRKASFEEAQFHIDICQFLMYLSVTKQYRFLRILNTSQTVNFSNTRNPRCLDDVRAYYTTNKYSIIENIPIPDFLQLKGTK